MQTPPKRVCWPGLLKKGNSFAGQPIRVHAAHTNAVAVAHHHPSEGHPAEFSSCSLYAITYLVGTTLKGLSIFGKEMPCVRIMRFLRFLGLAEEGTNVTVLLVLWDNLV